MMKLSEIRQAYEDLSNLASKTSRRNCLIGIIVVFSISIADKYISIPHGLRIPFMLIFASLLTDAVQYLISSVTWYCAYRRYKKCTNEDTVVYAPERYNIIPWICWIIKIVMMVLAYVLLIRFI